MFASWIGGTHSSLAYCNECLFSIALEAYIQVFRTHLDSYFFLWISSFECSSLSELWKLIATNGGRSSFYANLNRGDYGECK
ncbi:hypothetical protein ES319_D09G172000v1 [Gossypium barbadense]|uniref:Uncharacterized protein n=1 Tax=Gossypium barbadense TaxID=3634 RepID=A0A5J5Q678_GOSBA|nr:hypothetical protein ES319_D09G172000v1 [Gossypium barbadense]